MTDYSAQIFLLNSAGQVTYKAIAGSIVLQNDYPEKTIKGQLDFTTEIIENDHYGADHYQIKVMFDIRDF